MFIYYVRSCKVKLGEIVKWIINICILRFAVIFYISFYYYIIYRLMLVYLFDKRILIFNSVWLFIFVYMREVYRYWNK